MSTVQVLCPNGRRQNVRITPNTKLLQVLEEVCKKQGFLPPEDYNLVHGNNRKALDVTLSIRYANIPNNAKLELVKSERSRAEEDVLIALQLESGERLQQKFTPSTSLWDILLHWENLPDSAHKGHLTVSDSTSVPPIHPTCIYMREEVIGETALQHASLKKLGLTVGKAVIRLVHRPVEDSVIAEIIQNIEKEKNKQAHLENIARQKLQNDQPKAQQTQNTNDSVRDSSTENSSLVESKNLSPDIKDVSETSKSSSTEPMEVEAATESVPMETDSESSVKSFPNTVDTSALPKSDNITQKGISKENVVKSNNSEDRGSQDSSSHGSGSQGSGSQDSSSQSSSSQGSRRTQDVMRRQEEFAENIRQMNIPGVQIFTPGDFHNLSQEEQEVARRLAAYYMPQLGIQPTQEQRVDVAARPKKQHNNPTPFAEFKFPEETKGKNVYKNEFSEVNREEFKPCDREAVLFSMEEEVPSPSLSEELPDEFFEINENDVRRMYQDLQRRLKSDEDQPLMTKALQQNKLEERYSHYDNVVIRVQFPDKNVLQGLFRPKETVFAVQKFVKGYLEDKNLEFYLYTAPPKTVLKDRTQSLIEAHLAPATVVYFGTAQDRDHYLSEDTLKDVGPRSKADKIVEKSLSKSSTSEVPSTVSTSSNWNVPGPSSESRSRPKPKSEGPSSSSSSQKQPGMPKWFAAGKKK